MVRTLINYLRFARRKADEGHLPLSRQLLEMLLLYAVRRLGPGYYLFGRFWRRSIPLRDKLRHLNERAYVNRLSELNDPQYGKLSQHKIAEKALLSLLGVPTPRFLGFLHALDGRTRDGESLVNGTDLVTLIARQRPGAICCKPVEGWGGRGFAAARCSYADVATPKLAPLPDGTELDAVDFVKDCLHIDELNTGYIIEEYCEQHLWYARLNTTSVNTVRLYVIRSSEGVVCTLGGYLRIGRAGAIVDNASQGGLFCPIDASTGTTGLARFDRYDTDDLSHHPDSGVQLTDLELPYWPEIEALAGRALASLPHTRFAGIDIAVTENGPVVIEINVRPDRTAACDLDLPTLDMLDTRRGPDEGIGSSVSQ